MQERKKQSVIYHYGVIAARRTSSNGNQMIVEVLHLVYLFQMEQYLIEQEWNGDEKLSDKMIRIYTRVDPEEPGHPFIIPLLISPQVRNYLILLQGALERLATAENTTFVTIVCRVLQVKQITLLPEQSQLHVQEASG